MSDLPRAAGLAYREAGDPAAAAVLLVHGYPESSYMWRHAVAALAAAGRPYEGALARLGLPALIIWGGQDPFASPRMAERFHAELDGSELAVFEAAGHFVWEDEPQLTSERLVEFLARRSEP